MRLRIAAIAAGIALIAGCNTMHGVGEDISAGGRKVEDVLKKDKSSPSGTTGSDTTGTSSNSNANSPAAAPVEPSTPSPRTAPDASDTSMSSPPTNTRTQ